MSLWQQCIVACLAMAFLDCAGTFLVIAQSKGHSLLAGNLDTACDVAKQVLYAGSGAALIHRGWPVGWLWFIPVLVTGNIVTNVSTRIGRTMTDEAEPA